MEFKNPYMSTEDKIELLERWIIVHSIRYYEMDDPIIKDSQFDKNARQLAAMLRQFPQDAKKSKYAYCFKGFDGSTGHHLYRQLNKSDRAYLTQIAQMLDRVR